MPGRVPAILIMIALLFPLCAGCGDDDTPPLPATPAGNPVFELQFKPLTPLLPNRPTHIAADAIGNVYWVQESDGKKDTLFVIGQGDIPRATALSAASIAAALGAPGGRGNIQDIVAGNRGEIYFYFHGALGRQTLAALGQFHPKTQRIRMLATTDDIASATGMGRSLPLARGTLVADGGNVWLWIRHTDLGSVFRFDPTALAPDGTIQLVKAFNAVTFEAKPIAMTRDDLVLSSAGDGKLFVLDFGAARLLRAGPDGAATLVKSLVGFPSGLSTPAVDDKGQLLLFAANSPLLGVGGATTQAAGTGASGGLAPPLRSPFPGTGGAAPSSTVDATFPSLLIFDRNGQQVTNIDRDHILAYPEFPVFGTRLKQILPHPAQSAWLAYDANSGEFLMLQIRQREGP